ncbi:type I methionyl aminopeptidase [Natronosporangium hydrolyticum]|uniref:Methionine aminopeptidase n=1 Tax=Natronosporangium hydrolyticum TaxID=2811111 RepID=A0A895YJ16_9ACTN|nr:type I methionyl aminopeptidase [Natronosporangium hydrolyticum]QSB14120.1 type I methionyl aminopeptidase [Natronosporangium hydrolyticum]
MVELKTPAEIDGLRRAGQVVGQALAAVREQAAIGVRLRELDEIAAKVVADAGAEPLFRGYHPEWAPTPFPGVICASVNDAVVHGIPGDQRLADGDLVSIDCGARLDGWCGDAAISFIVGTPDPADQALIEATERALAAGVAAATAGARLSDISHAIGRSAQQSGYRGLADHGGHGIGRTMHEAPYVANDGPPGRGMRLSAGLVLALEPMLTRGGRRYRHDPDGWTVRTADGTRAAHAEHTVAVTESGPELLTVP